MEKLQPIKVCEAIVDTVIEHLCGEIEDTAIAIMCKGRTPPSVVEHEFMLSLVIDGEPYLVIAKHGS